MMAAGTLMTRLRALVARVGGQFLFTRRQDRRLAAELAAHLDLLADEHMRRGLSPDAARAAARRDFGGVDLIKETCRDQRGLPWMDALSRDLRYAVRVFRRSPAFVAVAVATLAIGIGANTALFSIVNAVLLRPLPYPNVDRLVMLSTKTPGRPQSLLSYNEYLAVRDQLPSIEACGLWLTQSVNLTGTAEPQRVLGAFVTGSFFDALGLIPERGRFFTELESQPGGSRPFAVVSRGFWERSFAPDATPVGASLILNGASYTVVGVLVSPFDPSTVPAAGSLLEADVFIPAGLFPGRNDLSSAGPSLFGIARIRQGTTVDALNADLGVVSARLAAAFPDTQVNRMTRAVDLQENLVGGSRPALLLLLAAVGVVLLIACANVSNLLLARAADRHKELALRTALGARRWTLVRQLAVEAGLLAAGSSALGLVAGTWSLQAMVWLRPPNVPIPAHVVLDRTVLLFTTLVAAAVAVLCGLVPALKLSRVQLTEAMQSVRQSPSGGRRTRESLVVAELALSVTLVALAGLLLQSLMAVQRVSLGFDPQRVLTLQFRLPPAKYRTPAAIARFFEQVAGAVRVVPGVESAALVRAVPLSGNGGETSYMLEGHPVVKGAEPQARYHLVSPDYFRTMRIALRRGRDFTDRDDLHAPPVAIVSETFARAAWPDDDAIGRRLRIPDVADWLTVVGVVADAKHATPTEPAMPQLYVSHYQNPMIFSSMVARTAVAPMALANVVRKAIWSVDKDQPVWAMQPLDAIVTATQGSWRFLATLVGIFAAVALAIAGVGIYGVMAYSVSQRTHEIGIRLALGASPSRVRREVIGRGLALTVGAVAIGLLGAAAAARVAASTLFGVGPADPVAFLAAAGVLAGLAVAACYVPARRASRVDPLVALRCE